MNILVIGTGAIGSFYGALLAKTGHCVSVVARSDYETVKAKGIRIRSATLGDYTFRPAAVVRSAAELETKPDCTLLCIKVVEGADRVGLLRDAVAPDTGIVLISNGIDIEPEVAAAFPDNEVISGLAFIGVTRTAPGEIWHQAYGRLMLGNYPGGVSERVKTLAAAFEEAGIDGIATENITTARWQKCVWNAAFNPLSVLSGGLDTLDILSTQEGFVRAIMQEIRAVAAANGHPLPEDIVEKNVASTYKMPPYKTSMLVDFEAGQPMETEVILGNAVRAGRRTRVAIPHLESVYALMKLLELRTSKSLWGKPAVTSTAHREAAEIFIDTWSLHGRVVSHNYMYHREIFADVGKHLAARFGGTGISVCDLGCGDACHFSNALRDSPCIT